MRDLTFEVLKNADFRLYAFVGSGSGVLLDPLFVPTVLLFRPRVVPTRRQVQDLRNDFAVDTCPLEFVALVLGMVFSLQMTNDRLLQKLSDAVGSANALLLVGFARLAHQKLVDPGFENLFGVVLEDAGAVLRVHDLAIREVRGDKTGNRRLQSLVFH